ncbi:MazG family protein [Luminiphilus syltensis NOR5-1B]|uniref:Nucleoside triphosphate pyrophosphohydrolase n=1 Tax=Luminiphilus syltensis NOR5-1B TaxID=565045 RepID=B8KRH4_9GAMM|nr:nucleoside triphosphate pyrophosphohydrolase [Luminiphilus syltensis]EED36524.1 MazG family protein [Luminiphilus syltensis NOR5-1B]
MDSSNLQHYTINDLLHVMSRLRHPDLGCPWDLKQNFKSITASTLEESYELVDAIEREDMPHVAEELGDLLFQVIFYSQLGKEAGDFDFDSVTHTLVEKLIRRHPHVFAGGDIDGVVQGTAPIAEVSDTWEAIKTEERREKSHHGILDDVPHSLPSLSRAQKLQKRAAGIGFDWQELSEVIDNLEAEIQELKQALEQQQVAAIADEMGDVFFSAVNVARHLGLDSEKTLRQSSRKFENRFRQMEKEADSEGVALSEQSSEQLEQRWHRVKSTKGNL